jgi:hypothetical protein
LGRASLRLWALNIALGVLQGGVALGHVSSGAPARAWVFAVLALVVTVASMSALAGLPLRAVALLPAPRLVAVAHATAWAAFQVAWLVDARVHDLFGFHLNGTAWAFLATPGVVDAVPLGPGHAACLMAGWLAVAAGELLAWRRCLPRRAGADHTPPRVRPVIAWVAAIFALAVVEKAMHVRADLRGDHAITRLSQLFPGYYRLTARRAAARWLGVRPAEPRLEAPSEELALRYAAQPVRLPDPGAAPNVVILVADSLRADALDEDVMPRTWRLASECRRFEDHLSGGNTTRFGIFTLLYGIHGSYWLPALNERRPPVLVEAVREAGHDVLVLSSASLETPELLSTAFVTVRDRAHGRLKLESPRAKDDALRVRALAWLRAREAAADERPFFLFALLDATHQVYSHPPGEAPYEPEASAEAGPALSGSPDAETVRRHRNRYLNAARYVDGVIGDVVDALRSMGELDRTLLVVTGDHGESFGEHGAWGHGSSPCPEQVRVPLLLRGPGVVPGVERRPTCHVDVAPTLLELSGVPAARRADHSTGESLLDPPAQRVRVVAGWDRLSVWTGDAVVSLPLHGWLGPPQVLDHACAPASGEAARLAHHAAALRTLHAETRRYLR